MKFSWKNQRISIYKYQFCCNLVNKVLRNHNQDAIGKTAFRLLTIINLKNM